MAKNQLPPINKEKTLISGGRDIGDVTGFLEDRLNPFAKPKRLSCVAVCHLASAGAWIDKRMEQTAARQ